ncbi:TPA: ATP-binding cassette domain-containing protein, partial [Candidatus Micrarchaeota archaeon]|nr:ATP-binding cassette domain-containing protein [Candidatus Micrarchaeota archaeon]
MSDSLIQVDALSKKFGSFTAVDGVSFEVRQGEVFGLLGPNGAGKTTLISMLVALKKPSSGRALVNGFDVATQADEVRNSIGIVFQDPSLDEELTARENLELHVVMYGMPSSARAARIAEVARIVGLEDRLDSVVKTFSGGMRRRLEIARSLLHYHKILFLDEPTLGLDPQTRKHVWDYVRRLKKEHGMTIVLTTHYLDEADSLCDRIAIVDGGKVVALGSPDALKNKLGGDVIEVESSDGACLAESLAKQEWVRQAK